MINRDALAWLSSQSNRPFFLFLNYFDAHDPYVLPEGARQAFSSDLESARRFPIRSGLGTPTTIALRYLDEQIGRLFGELERRGVLENTLDRRDVRSWGRVRRA